MNKYNIAEILFHATSEKHVPVYVECPDCGGTGRLRVIFHDETIVSIDCRNCASGYDAPTGKVLIYQNKVSVEDVVISGMDIQHGKSTKYKVSLGTNCYRTIEEDVLFKTKEEAMGKAEELHAEFVKQEKERVYKKEKDARTWAWNASYHRNLIKRAHKDIEYHTEKLNAANLKKRESKKGSDK